MGQQEKRRKREVDEIISSSKEEMGKAIEKLRQDNELRIKSLEEQHSKKQMQLKSQYEEKMILFSTSSASRAPTCTVSESQLRQSLIEAKEEIQALKEQKNQMVCVRLRKFFFAPCRFVLYAVSEIYVLQTNASSHAYLHAHVR